MTGHDERGSRKDDIVPYKVRSFQTTPNPNALKCVVEPSPAPREPRSYASAEQSGDDAVGRALFAIEGVTNLLIHDGWITVGKLAESEWKVLKPAIERALAGV